MNSLNIQNYELPKECKIPKGMNRDELIRCELAIRNILGE